MTEETNQDIAEYIKDNYIKQELYIPMRDGIKLFTQIYSPVDNTREYPILLFRTPYSVKPYGTEKENYSTRLGPTPRYVEEGFIFVNQDVRGKQMSEGDFVNMTPHVQNKKDNEDVDESSDTWDTIDWLINNLENHNGKVGQLGISYPGFYTIAGAIDTHPNLVAISPQAPVADWFFDDFHHHGAFFLAHSYYFTSWFSHPRHGLTKTRNKRFDYGTEDGYKFYLDIGPLKNVNTKYFGDSLDLWNDMIEHPNYDDYWQSRNILPHLKNIKSAVLTVGGWYDAEDLYGPLKIYRTVEKENPDIFNALVMGPWVHGGWHSGRSDGTSLGDIWFGEGISAFFQNELEFSFFMHYLKGIENPGLSEAHIFETGTNQWREFDNWPPENLSIKRLFFHKNQGLSFSRPITAEGYDEFISDPNKPVPFTEKITPGMIQNYMADDQRFAARRPDVLVYQTEILDKPITIAGPLQADLKVSVSGTAADWVVKLIDVYPSDHPGYPHNEGKFMGDYQQMVRSESIRGRYRNSYSTPEPFIPEELTTIELELQDVLHTFKKGHRIMIQIQSTWFPLIDRNPQKYMDNIFLADEDDFIKARHRIYRDSDNASFVEVGILK
ncbi:CocE/NonD family hydrolase [Bacteroidota bacterium]